MAELFANAEVNREARWQVLSQLVVCSLAFHIIALVTLMYVPAVRDTFNIAALLSDTGYVDKAYARTEIGDDVNVLEMPRERFRYPPGYFATETELRLAQALQTTAVNPPVTVDFRPTQQSTPLPSPSPEVSPTPSPIASPAASPATATAANADVKAEAPKTTDQAETEMNKIAAANSVVRPSENEINTRPLKDWLARADAMRNKGELISRQRSR